MGSLCGLPAAQQRDEWIDVVETDGAVADQVAMEGLEAQAMVPATRDDDEAAVRCRDVTSAVGVGSPRYDRAVGLQTQAVRNAPPQRRP